MYRSGELGYVPVQLIQHCMQKHIENSLRVYLVLKYWSNTGTIRLDSELKKKLSKQLGITPRTLNNQIKRLEQLKWIAIDKNNTTFIRGFNWLQYGVEYPFKTKVLITEKYLTKENFKGYLMGAVIGYFVKLQRARMYTRGRGKARSKWLNYTPFPLSYSYLKAISNKCDNEIKKRIEVAVKLKLIRKYESLQPLDISRSEFLLLKRQGFDGDAYPIWREGKAFLQYSNEFLGLMDYKRFARRKK